ncbi:MAG TPA: M23 family metallopeptidase [Bacteroidales bacterium]|nr:M23 family metallopeptidase [Bacteroidales bacterium]
MLYRGILIFVAALLLNFSENPVTFHAPLNIPLSLSATFGELRSGHFHSGVDFKTNGTTGHNVYSVDAGWIYRISVGPTGFGKAIYIRHPNGYSTVYGHLDSFVPEIEQFVREYQYNRESFRVEIFPENELFPVSEGQFIGLSGNSGSSNGPHLHFEVRRSDNEHPVDPLRFFKIADDIKPRIDKLAIYSLQNRSGQQLPDDKTIYALVIQNNIYRVKDNRVIKVNGPFGIGIITWDFINSSWNKCGIKSIDLKVDGKQVYNHLIDEFSFSETRYINSHIDYADQMRTGRYIQKTFIEPNNKLSIYNYIVNRGIIEFQDEEVHKVEITVTDFGDNISHLRFDVQSTELKNEIIREREQLQKMYYSTRNSYTHPDIRITFPEDCFYDDLYFDYRREPSDTNLFADLHHIHNKYVPVHNPFELSIKVNPLFEKYADKLGIVYLDNGTITFTGGEWKDGFVTTGARALGTYSVGIDTIPPTIKALTFREGSDLACQKTIIVEIDDDFSGIKEYKATIDGNWALFEWDPKNKRLTYEMDRERITKGSPHYLELIVTDNRNNTTTWNISFFW